MTWLRRVRGAVGIGLAWAFPWWVVGTAMSPYLRVLAKAIPPQSLGEAIVDGSLIGWYGFLAGAMFSFVLAIAGRRRDFSELTTSRVLRYAVASSALLMGPPMVYMLAGRTDGWRLQDAVYLAGGMILTAGCSVGTLLAARRAGLAAPLTTSGSVDSAVPGANTDVAQA
jgi:hypothetical protein